MECRVFEILTNYNHLWVRLDNQVKSNQIQLWLVYLRVWFELNIILTESNLSQIRDSYVIVYLYIFFNMTEEKIVWRIESNCLFAYKSLYCQCYIKLSLSYDLLIILLFYTNNYIKKTHIILLWSCSFGSSEFEFHQAHYKINQSPFFCIRPTKSKPVFAGDFLSFLAGQKKKAVFFFLLPERLLQPSLAGEDGALLCSSSNPSPRRKQWPFARLRSSRLQTSTLSLCPSRL